MEAKNHGFCPERLGNIDAYLKRIIDEGKVAGAAGMIIRRGIEAYHSSFGYKDMENKTLLKNDDIYRIYSMTKTITITAAMSLYEKGLFRLHQPIADFLPAFKNMQVAETDSRGIVKLVPAKNPITFWHLFTMTSGIPYPGKESYSARLMEESYRQSSNDSGSNTWNTARMIDETAKIPLCFHPGEQWLYGFSHDVLGRLIEVISGLSLGEYFSKTVFEPLGMKDTAFFVPPEKQERLVKPYILDSQGLKEIKDPHSFTGREKAPAFESGGGGLCSTMADCALFAQMLLNNGKLGKYRILSRKTIELIRSNHCDPEILEPSFFPQMRGYGYGLGVRTMMDTAKAGLNSSKGEWAWDGLMGTYFLVDPAEDMTALFFIQLRSEINSHLQRCFVQTVYGAIDD